MKKLTFFIVIALAGCGRSDQKSVLSEFSKDEKPSVLSQFSKWTQRLHPKPSPLKPRVIAVEIGTKFFARFGGGTDISPSEGAGAVSTSTYGDSGIPRIQISEGHAFVAGEIRGQDERSKLVRIVIDFENPLEQTESFKIGDVALIAGKDRSNDFLAVGYGSQLCAIEPQDKRAVKEIVVQIPPKDWRTLSFVFALPRNDSKQGSIVIGDSTPVPFQVDPSAGK